MSIAAEKVAEIMALPEEDRALLAHQLIASLDDTVDPGAEKEWHKVIESRSREMEAGRLDTRTEEEVVGDIRKKLHARRQTS